MELQALCIHDDANKRNSQLKRAFAPFEDPPVIDELVPQAICVLVNLTQKLTPELDILDSTSCKRLLRDKKWLFRIAKTYRYRITHNLKFPDYRKQGSIRLNALGKLPVGYWSSNVFSQQPLDWSQNSADVNMAMFLTARFKFEGQCTTLGELIIQGNPLICDNLVLLGLYKKDLKWLKETLAKVAGLSTLHDLSQPYLSQLRYPVAGGYLSLTPVVSVQMQIKFFNWLCHNCRHRWIHYCQRSSSVGRFAASVGGRIFVYSNRLSRLNQPHTQAGRPLLPRWKAFHVLSDWLQLSTGLVPVNRKNQLQKQLMIQIDALLSQWLSARYDISPDQPKLNNSSQIVADLNAYFVQSLPLRSLAYRPELIRLLERRIAKLMLNNGPELEEFSRDGDFQYIVLPDLKVSHANGYACDYIVGIPSMIGLYGFVHLFLRQLMEGREDIVSETSFAVCLHDYALHRRGLVKEQQINPQGCLKTPGITDSAHCDFLTSLIIRVPKCFEFKHEQIVFSVPQKLCGGAVHSDISALNRFSVSDSFKQAKEQITCSHGRWLTPSQLDDLNAECNFDDWLAEISKDHTKAISCLGYHFLEKPSIKQAALDNCLHIFAEPVLGTIVLKFTPVEKESELFWEYRDQANYLLLCCKE